MSKESLQKGISDKGGFILSDGTLNMRHLLPKAYDLLVGYEIDADKLKEDILSCFLPDTEDMAVIKEYGLFFAQYHGMVPAMNWTLADELWNEDIFNLFNSLSPDGYSFGSSEGDGACIGWFKYEQEVQ